MSKDKIVYTIYECIYSIPELNIRKGMQFIKDERSKYKSIKGQTELPSYIDVHNTHYFKKGDMTLSYAPHDLVIYRLNKNNTALGIIQKVTPTGVTVSDVQNSKATRVIEHAAVIKKVSCYYFISSSGTVQKAYTDKDKNADWWRKNTGNYYETSDEAHAAKHNIESTFKIQEKEF